MFDLSSGGGNGLADVLNANLHRLPCGSSIRMQPNSTSSKTAAALSGR